MLPFCRGGMNSAPGERFWKNSPEFANTPIARSSSCRPNSKTEIAGSEHAIPNLNVLFEFGFFYGALGRANVAVVRYGEIHLPSDLGGYIHITGSKHFTPRRAVAVGKRTKEEFARWLHPLRRHDEASEKPKINVAPQRKFPFRRNFVTGWRDW